MVARPDPDEVIINKLTGLPARADETTLFTPPRQPKRKWGRGWYFVYILALAVPAAWATDAMGLSPWLGATVIWFVVAMAAVFYHHWVLRQVKTLQRDLDVAQRSHLEEEVARAWNAPSRPAPAPWARNGRE